MDQAPEVPPLPPAILRLAGDLRTNAERAWRNAHGMLHLLDAWFGWLRRSKWDFDRNRTAPDNESGDHIAHGVAAAFGRLCELGLRQPEFYERARDLGELLPLPPSDALDREFYVTDHDPDNEAMLRRGELHTYTPIQQATLLSQVGPRALRRLIADLEAEPASAFAPSVEASTGKGSQPNARSRPKDNSANGVAITEDQLAQILAAVGDESARAIIQIAHRNDWSADRKMHEIIRLDATYGAKNSTFWGSLLGVKPAAIRQGDTWKAIKAAERREG